MQEAHSSGFYSNLLGELPPLKTDVLPMQHDKDHSEIDDRAKLRFLREINSIKKAAPISGETSEDDQHGAVIPMHSMVDKEHSEVYDRAKLRFLKEINAIRKAVPINGETSEDDENIGVGKKKNSKRSRKRRTNDYDDVFGVYITDDQYFSLLRNHAKAKCSKISVRPNSPEVSLESIIERSKMSQKVRDRVIKYCNNAAKESQMTNEKKKELFRRRMIFFADDELTECAPLQRTKPPVMNDSDLPTLPNSADELNDSCYVNNHSSQKNKERNMSIYNDPSNQIKVSSVNNQSALDHDGFDVMGVANKHEIEDATDMIESDLDTVKMEDTDIGNMEDIEMESLSALTQSTHQCFFSLLRDIFATTKEQRTSLPHLKDSLRIWQDSPISPLNDWYSCVDSWVEVLSSALHFLGGIGTELIMDDFVPYLEYKESSDTYQWIGAGRDSDVHVIPLCELWLERRDSMITTHKKMSKSRSVVDMLSGEDEVDSCRKGEATPSPRCPTDWTVSASTDEEREYYQIQERYRYNTPSRPFTFHHHGFEAVVGPVKGISNTASAGSQTKPRGHNLLTPDRPSYVTILTLVRDAVSRLPNGEGTRSEICTLLRDSQYINLDAPDNSLSNVVSGALDRLHGEPDPCVKYDNKRKQWIYLHRNRNEEDFDRIHQQLLTVTPKPKKITTPRKPSNRSRPVKVETVKATTPQLTTTSAVMPLGTQDTPSIVSRASPKINITLASTSHITTPTTSLFSPSTITSTPSPTISNLISPSGGTVTLPISSLFSKKQLESMRVELGPSGCKKFVFLDQGGVGGAITSLAGKSLTPISIQSTQVVQTASTTAEKKRIIQTSTPVNTTTVASNPTQVRFIQAVPSQSTAITTNTIIQANTAAKKQAVVRTVVSPAVQQVQLRGVTTQQMQIRGVTPQTQTVRLQGGKSLTTGGLVQIQTPGGVQQLALLTQGGVIPLNNLQESLQTKLLQALQQQQVPTGAGQQQQVTVTSAAGVQGTQTITRVALGRGTTTGKPILQVPAGMRVVGQLPTSAGTFNVAQIGGKHVLLAANKTHANTMQNVVLAPKSSQPQQTVVLPAGTTLPVRTQAGGTLLLSASGTAGTSGGATQHLILPSGFAGGNLQGIKGLPGFKVIPVSQANTQNKGKQTPIFCLSSAQQQQP